MAGAETWHRILNAIERLQAKAPAEGRRCTLPITFDSVPYSFLDSALFKVRPARLQNRAASRSDAARITEVAVSSYRVYFLDAGDHVASTDLIACDTEANAGPRAPSGCLVRLSWRRFGTAWSVSGTEGRLNAPAGFFVGWNFFQGRVFRRSDPLAASPDPARSASLKPRTR